MVKVGLFLNIFLFGIWGVILMTGLFLQVMKLILPRRGVVQPKPYLKIGRIKSLAYTLNMTVNLKSIGILKAMKAGWTPPELEDPKQVKEPTSLT